MQWDKEERRMNSDERLGYIEARMESVGDDIRDLKENGKDHNRREEKDREVLMQKLDLIVERQNDIRNELTVYKRLFKIILGTVVAVLTASLGDIAKYFK